MVGKKCCEFGYYYCGEIAEQFDHERDESKPPSPGKYVNALPLDYQNHSEYLGKYRFFCCQLCLQEWKANHPD